MTSPEEIHELFCEIKWADRKDPLAGVLATEPKSVDDYVCILEAYVAESKYN
jgi:hypothetical protein